MPSGTIVAVGIASSVNQPVAYSTDDGQTWTAATTPLDGVAAVATGVASNGRMFMAAGGPDASFTNAGVIASADGITWTSVTVPWSTAEMQAGMFVAWCAGTWLVLRSADPTGADPTVFMMFSTDDGTSWTTVDTTTQFTLGLSVGSVGSTFVIGMRLPGGPPCLAYAPAASPTSWTVSFDGSGATDWSLEGYALWQADGQLVAAFLQDAVKFYITSDGITWTALTTALDSQPPAANGDIIARSMVFSPPLALWLAMVTNESTSSPGPTAVFETSPDLTTWTTEIGLPFDGSRFSPLLWTGTSFVAGSNFNAPATYKPRMGRSTDGSTWVETFATFTLTTSNAIYQFAMLAPAGAWVLVMTP